MKKIILLLTLLTLNFASAAVKDGINFADKVIVEGKELVLNGIGIRKATFLKVKVYYGGLYLEQKTQKAETFLTTPAPKQIIMNFVHDVEAKKLRNGFNDGLEAANKNHKAFTASMEKFNALLEDVIKGDKITINFLVDGVEVIVKNKNKEKIKDADFSKALLNIWFINPGDEGLRDGLLSI